MDRVEVDSSVVSVPLRGKLTAPEIEPNLDLD